MDTSEYLAFVSDLEGRLQTLQKNYIAQQDDNAQLVGPLLAITMLVKSELLPFARDRYLAIVDGPQWKVAEDHVLALRDDVEFMLAGPVVYHNRHVG
ncbi:hypothetical protein A9Q73_06455 [Bermanella sp. 47_1433_sub80_T6]|nr:hypothetical protein A9Q73_06455 [Bermanella sp. 47_1433_sub80_T6]